MSCKIAGSTCTFALKIAGTSDFFGGLAIVCCVVRNFFGYVIEKESVCFSFVSRIQQITLSTATSCNSFHRTKTLGL
jgi:hypothetical protein